MQGRSHLAFSGADIEIDGALVGGTLSTVTVASGSLQIAVKKKGFTDWSKTLKVTGGTIHLNAELEQEPANPKRKRMPEILSTMTVKEAARCLPETLRKRLQRWGETFGITLGEFHVGHIRTYQIDRSKEVEAAVVDWEVAGLLIVLRKLNLSSEIERSYTPITGSVRKPDDGRCLYREQFVKKDGTISHLRRQCPRQAYIHEQGGLNRYCDEHLKASLDGMRRALDPTKPRVSYIPGSKTVQ